MSITTYNDFLANTPSSEMHNISVPFFNEATGEATLTTIVGESSQKVSPYAPPVVVKDFAVNVNDTPGQQLPNDITTGPLSEMSTTQPQNEANTSNTSPDEAKFMADEKKDSYAGLLILGAALIGAWALSTKKQKA